MLDEKVPATCGSAADRDHLGIEHIYQIRKGKPQVFSHRSKGFDRIRIAAGRRVKNILGCVVVFWRPHAGRKFRRYPCDRCGRCILLYTSSASTATGQALRYDTDMTYLSCCPVGSAIWLAV